MSHKKNVLVNVHDMFTLPESAPSIDFILRTTAFPHIDHTSVINKKIVFCGHIDLCIEYVSRTTDCTQSVYFVHFELPFNCNVIQNSRIKRTMNVQLKATVEYQHVDIHDCRCIEAISVVKVSILNVTSSCKKLPSHVSHPNTIHCCTFPQISKSEVCELDSCNSNSSTSCDDSDIPLCTNDIHQPEPCCSPIPDASSTYYHDWCSDDA